MEKKKNQSMERKGWKGSKVWYYMSENFSQKNGKNRLYIHK